MIASLRGTLIDKDNTSAVVECGGVGIRCYITAVTSAALPSVNEEVFLYTHLVVREDAFDLYGFQSRGELEAFKLITTVSGVGAKIGLALLSQFTSDRLMLCIASGDSRTLTAANGVGSKLAQRIVLELKDKVGSLAQDNGITEIVAVNKATKNTACGEAIEALVSLGYSQSEAAQAVGKLDPSLSAQELIKLALKSLARGL